MPLDQLVDRINAEDYELWIIDAAKLQAVMVTLGMLVIAYVSRWGNQQTRTRRDSP